jgi:hypothetical protein
MWALMDGSRSKLPIFVSDSGLRVLQALLLHVSWLVSCRTMTDHRFGAPKVKKGRLF